MERWCQKINVHCVLVVKFVSSTARNKPGFCSPAAHLRRAESALLEMWRHGGHGMRRAKEGRGGASGRRWWVGGWVGGGGGAGTMSTRSLWRVSRFRVRQAPQACPQEAECLETLCSTDASPFVSIRGGGGRESGTAVPLPTSAASAPWRPSRAGAGDASDKVLPKAMKSILTADAGECHTALRQGPSRSARRGAPRASCVCSGSTALMECPCHGPLPLLVQQRQAAPTTPPARHIRKVLGFHVLPPPFPPEEREVERER